jgi:hypothetical protein
MNFKKIQKDAAKRYGSEEAGKRVAGSILKKVLKKEEIGSNDPETSYEDGGTDENRDIIVTANDLYYYPKDKLVATFWHAYPGTGEHIFHQGDVVKPNDKYYKMILNSPALEEDSDYEFDEEENNSTSKNLPTAPSQEETDANQVYENDLNEAALSPKAVEYIKNYIDKFDERAMAVKLVDIALKSSAGVESSDLPDTSTFANGVDEIQSLLEDQEYNKAYQMAKETAQEMLDEEGFGNLNEAKEFTKGGDQVNPYELEKGTYYELDCQKDGAKDTKKAKAKAIKNLNKNPKYYSDLFSKNYDDKPNTSDQMQIVKESLKNLINDDKGQYLLTETQFFTWDAKLWNKRRKVVQNKNARHNLNFSDHKQTADFENGKGTTIPWSDVPLITLVRKKLKDAFGDSAKDLKCEGNLYYDCKKTGIGYHGDTERRKVIGVRLGKEMTIHYMWYHNYKPVGVNISMKLNPGDIYCMSEKTVGTDWMKKKIYTLRHAAGASMYTTNTPNIILSNPKTKGDITKYNIKISYQYII